MLSVLLGLSLIAGGALVLLAVFRPDAFRAYFYRSRHCPRACARRAARAADPYERVEADFREWRKQYPALLEETQAMPRVPEHVG
jgi:hypothetical protein